jgi:hypothetical protein
LFRLSKTTGPQGGIVAVFENGVAYVGCGGVASADFDAVPCGAVLDEKNAYEGNKMLARTEGRGTGSTFLSRAPGN